MSNDTNKPKRRVLLIDDEPGMVKLVSRKLEMIGFEVVTAADGQDGLTKARLGRPDVIVLDLVLPKLSGLEVCAALKQDPQYQHIPIIICTGMGQAMDEKLCRECGANAYINKSHDTSALVEQIEALLGTILPDEPSGSGPPGAA